MTARRTTSAASGACAPSCRCSSAARPRTSSTSCRSPGRSPARPPGPYSASKHAQLAFSRGVAAELEPAGDPGPRGQPGPRRRRAGFPQERAQAGRYTRHLVVSADDVAAAVVTRAVEHDRRETFIPPVFRIAARRAGARARRRSRASRRGLAHDTADVSRSRRRGNEGPMARLRRADLAGPGITRRRRGRGWEYFDENGEWIGDLETLERIRELAIPPAWNDVWICPYPNGHIQAIGIDAAGRKQYRYHQRWRERRDQIKFDRMTEFARALPTLARGGRRRTSSARASPRARPRRRGPPPRPRVLPDRRRGVRGGERELRPRDDEEDARDARRELLDLVRLPGQERQAADEVARRPGRLRARRRAEATARGRARAPRLPVGRSLVRRQVDRHQLLHQGGRRAATSPPRTSAPGAGTVLAAVALSVSGAVIHVQDRAQARDRARDPGGRPLTSATPPPSPGPPTSTPASSTATSRAG